jgi:hypothetical protein
MRALVWKWRATMKRILGAGLVVLLTLMTLLALEPPGVVKSGESGEYILPAGKTVSGVLFISSPGVVTIEQGARVDGAVFMGSGVLNVNGEVGGGIFSLSGEVHLAPSAVVRGHVNVTSVPFEPTPGARIERNLAADVSGWMGGPIGAALVLLVLAAYLLYGAAIRTLLFNRGQVGAQLRDKVITRAHLAQAAGVALATAGAVVVARLAGVDDVRVLWALALLTAAAALLALMLAGRPQRSPLAIPATALAAAGLIVSIQTATGRWESWAYLWAVVLPTSIGLGRLSAGWWGHEPRRVRAGLRLSEMGLALVAASVVVIAGASYLSGGAVAGLIALLLVGIGGYLLISRFPHRGGQPTGA